MGPAIRAHEQGKLQILLVFLLLHPHPVPHVTKDGTRRGRGQPEQASCFRGHGSGLCFSPPLPGVCISGSHSPWFSWGLSFNRQSPHIDNACCGTAHLVLDVEKELELSRTNGFEHGGKGHTFPFLTFLVIPQLLNTGQGLLWQWRRRPGSSWGTLCMGGKEVKKQRSGLMSI